MAEARTLPRQDIPYIWWTLLVLQAFYALCFLAAFLWTAIIASAVIADGVTVPVTTWAYAYATSLLSDSYVHTVALQSVPLNGLVAAAIILGLRFLVCIANISNLLVNHPRARSHWLASGLKLVIMYGYFQDFIAGLNAISTVSDFVLNGLVFAISLAYTGQPFVLSISTCVYLFTLAGFLFAVAESSIAVRLHRVDGYELLEEKDIAENSKADLAHAAPSRSHHSQAWDSATFLSGVFLVFIPYILYYTPFVLASPFYSTAQGEVRRTFMVLFWVPFCWTAFQVIMQAAHLFITYGAAHISKEALRTLVAIALVTFWAIELEKYIVGGPSTDAAAAL